MANLTPDAWQAVSPYLDQALTLEEPELSSWLASIRQRDPGLADALRQLLDDRRALAEEHFLEHSPLSPARAPGRGETIGAYKLLSQIGEGGMGTVWLAERSDGRFDRLVAIKFLNIALGGGNRGERQERFRREGKLLGRLVHPHIAQLMDAGVSPAGQPYLVLEHVEGEPIDRYCEQLRLDLDARIRLVLGVLAAVAQAHANLIVHRDIKPSNVLVRRDGEVKLLDFGIAKIVEPEGETGLALTREGGGALTLLYAAPEQVTGGIVTTATDVYTLGVLLYVLLTGQHPAGPGPHSPAALVRSIVDLEPPRLSDAPGLPDKLRRRLRGDLDTIAAKALKKNPQERYGSVTTLAEDLRRHLRHEPIGARPDTLAYRAAKFVRRNRTAVALGALASIAVLAGLLGATIQTRTARRERAIAQRRFNDVRQLANRLFDIDLRVRELPGGSKTRQLIVDTSLDYLGRLSADARSDPDLALDLGAAYMRVGRVQGVSISTNLGQSANAEKNLQIAERLIASVLAAQPSNRTAFLRAAQIAHDRMILAGERRPSSGALPLARVAEQWLDKYLRTGPVDEAEKDQAVMVGTNVASRYMKENLFDEGLRLCRRMIEVGWATNQPNRVGAAEIIVARGLHRTGDLEGALAAARDAVRLLDPAPGDQRVGRSLAFGMALLEEGNILGDDEGVSLGRYKEAAQLYERCYRMAADLARQDAGDAESRLRVTGRGIQLANVLRHSDPRQALAIYDEVLARSAEIQNNPRARRDEARALAGSTYPLRQLGRSAEARRRLDAAFVRLKDLKLYPAAAVDLGSEAASVLAASADLEAGLRNVPRALEIYQQLLDKIMASKPKPESDLADANDLSILYRSMAALHRRAGHAQAASAFDARVSETWRNWDRKLPHNPFVLRQIASPPAP